MILLSETFHESYPADLLELLQQYEDNWRLTIPGDAVNPIPWLERYSAPTLLPTYPEAGSSLCLVVVLMAEALDGSDVHVLAALVPSADMFMQLFMKLVHVYEYALTRGCIKIPLLGVFFTLPRSIVCERDPELFSV